MLGFLAFGKCRPRQSVSRFDEINLKPRRLFSCAFLYVIITSACESMAVLWADNHLFPFFYPFEFVVAPCVNDHLRICGSPLVGENGVGVLELEDDDVMALGSNSGVFSGLQLDGGNGSPCFWPSMTRVWAVRS